MAVELSEHIKRMMRVSPEIMYAVAYGTLSGALDSHAPMGSYLDDLTDAVKEEIEIILREQREQVNVS